MTKSYKYNRSRKPISLEDAQLKLVDCIKQLEKVILNGEYDPKEMQMKIQATYAMSNAINRYSVLVEKIDFEQRLTKLENQIHEEH